MNIIFTGFLLLIGLFFQACHKKALFEGTGFWNKKEDFISYSSDKECRILLTEQKRTLLASGSSPWLFNSENSSKTNEFIRLFQSHGLVFAKTLEIDLPEIQASASEVVFHKALGLNQDWLIVEDSSLDVESLDIGVNLKWYIKDIPTWIGKKAVLHSHIAYRLKDTVFVFQGSVKGQMVSPRGELISGQVLSSYFQPEGYSQTLAEGVPYQANPRAIAVKNFIDGHFLLCGKKTSHWRGFWQKT